MRYYLVSFNLKNRAIFGEILLTVDGFPSRYEINKLVSQQLNESVEIIVINIFEFKSEEDYINFKN
jgi:hypothetical protein